MTFYATFGNQSAFRNHYLIVEAPDEAAARSVMFAHFKDRWAFLYSHADPVEKYNLACIGTITEFYPNLPTFKGA